MSNRAKSAAALPIRDVVRSYLKTKHEMVPVSIARVSRLARLQHPDLALPDSLLADLIAREALSAGRTIHFDGKEAWPEFSLAAPATRARSNFSILRDHSRLVPASMKAPSTLEPSPAGGVQ